MKRNLVFSAILIAAGFVPIDGAFADPPQIAKRDADARALLTRVRDKLKSLKSYHFERKTTLHEAKAGGEVTPVAELTFFTIADFPASSEVAKDTPKTPGTIPLPIPYQEGRFRFELKTPDGDFLLVGDGTNGWFYSSAHKMYRRGDTLWSLSESILGPVLANAHLFPFMALTEGATKDAKFVREEEIDVGKERRKCTVIKMRVPNPDLAGMMSKAIEAGKDGKSPEVKPSDLEREMPKAFVAAGWNFSKLKSFGYLRDKSSAKYITPRSKEKQFTDVTLWIDTERSLFLRAEFREPAQKVADLVVASLPAEEVELQVTEQFTVMEINPKLKDDLFAFSPPEGVKEPGEGGGPSWRHYSGGGVFSTAPPSLSDDGKKLIFSWPKTGHGDIYLYDLEKKQATRLTSSGATDLSPRFRPKHQEIFFQREEGPRTHVWIRDLVSGKERPLTTGQGSFGISDVSPDGKDIAISKDNRRKPDNELQILTLESGKSTFLPPCAQGLFRGSGETLICWKYGEKEHSIFEVDREGKNVKPIADKHYLQALDSKKEFALITPTKELLANDQNNVELVLLNLNTRQREAIGKGYEPCIFDNGKILFVTNYKRDPWIWERGKGAHRVDGPRLLDLVSPRPVGNQTGVSAMLTGRTIISALDKVNDKLGDEGPFLFNAETEKFETLSWQPSEGATNPGK